jgi:hypothetical protein
LWTGNDLYIPTCMILFNISEGLSFPTSELDSEVQQLGSNKLN